MLCAACALAASLLLMMACQTGGRPEASNGVDTSGALAADTIEVRDRSRQRPGKSSAAPGDEHSSAAAVRVVRDYYQAIREGRYRDAYVLWESGGAASAKTFEEFRSGFSETADVQVRPGTPGRIEGAAGSRYVEVPVRIIARSRDRATQEFAGTYTLRLSVVDGATKEQRTWHMHSADIRRVTSPGK